jgi:hypothetical protein
VDERYRALVTAMDLDNMRAIGTSRVSPAKVVGRIAWTDKWRLIETRWQACVEECWHGRVEVDEAVPRWRE